MSVNILAASTGDIHMSTGKILISGATGDTGGYAIDRLVELGHEVRALAHNRSDRSERLRERGVEVVYGDLLDFGQVRAALDGVRRAYFVYPLHPGILQAAAYFAQAAREAGVEGIVNLSQKSARPDATSHAAQDHWVCERVFDWSGVPTAHLRPTFFAEWLLYLAPMIRQGQLRVPFGTGRHAPVAAEDQGRVIAGLLADPATHGGEIFPLFGPLEVTYEETAAVLSRVLGKPVRYEQVDFDAFRRAMPTTTKAAGRDDSFLFQHLEEVAIDHQNGIFAGTNDLVERIGGRPPMTLEAFIEKHHAAFA